MDIDVFLRPLVDELKELWVNGVDTRDCRTNTVFKLRAALLWTINDFPARSYLSGHRRFFPNNHRMRRDTQFDGKIERRPPPRRFTCEEVLEQNVCDSLLGTILDNDKSKDTTNARHDLKKQGVREWLWIYEDERGKLLKPHAPSVLKPDDRLQFCKFIKDVKFPDGFCSNLKKKVNKNLTNVIGLKSHDCRVIMQRLLSVGVRKFLPNAISTTISELCNFFRHICSRTINVKDMEVSQQDLILILCKMESIFPPAFFDIVIHLVLHFPEEAILGGPIFMRWMYLFERYMKKLKNYVGNKARPEGSIEESYVVDEALTFCSMYFKGVETRFSRLDRNEDEVVPRKLSVFQSQCRPITKGNLRPLDRASREQIYDFHKSGSLENGEELLALASGSDHLGTYYEGCIVNGVRFMATKRDAKRSTQNSGLFVVGTEDDPYILASQAKQVFYLDDLLRGKNWKIVENVNHRQIWAIVDDDANVEVDLVHDTNSSNFVLTVDLRELILIPDQPPMDIGTEPSLHVNEDDRNMDDEDTTEESDEEILVDLCEDDVNDHLVNNDSDMND
ncbi:uncharacterized protein LOC115696468 [Cannabis sativa]|uniref:uncharacterized protein LOC115696468 n=1 Tax=Cannabis sativa TaxID=3483 RepID=UPI0011DF55AE|nr:uncharacterized protein LOC115696468 [Cannabis sativa]